MRDKVCPQLQARFVTVRGKDETLDAVQEIAGIPQIGQFTFTARRSVRNGDCPISQPDRDQRVPFPLADHDLSGVGNSGAVVKRRLAVSDSFQHETTGRGRRLREHFPAPVWKFGAVNN